MIAALAHTLFEPWSNAFMQRALAELVLVGIVGGVLGCWVIFYEISYSAESLAHALFPGLVVAALAGVPLLLGGAVGVLAAAILVAAVARVPEIGHDAAVAVVITGLFGLGAVLALSPDSPPGLSGLLFGDLLGVSTSDLALAAGLAAATMFALVLVHGLLLTVGFDRSTARAYGARPLLADIVLLTLLAAAILIGVQGLGNLLVVAVIIGPAATARLYARRMTSMMTLAAVIAVVDGVAGLYLSYYANTAAGASVAAVLVATYVVAFFARVVRRQSRHGRALAVTV
jgi:ABC-type Mn2+/Zn2+ transport system permease subunit